MLENFVGSSKDGIIQPNVITSQSISVSHAYIGQRSSNMYEHTIYSLPIVLDWPCYTQVLNNCTTSEQQKQFISLCFSIYYVTFVKVFLRQHFITTATVSLYGSCIHVVTDGFNIFIQPFVNFENRCLLILNHKLLSPSSPYMLPEEK